MIDTKIIKAIAKGIVTYIPGASSILDKKKRTSKHSGSKAEFCYDLWLRILVFLEENSIRPHFKAIGELGSGGSLGVGICALLSGCERYYALEIDSIFDKDQNLKILDDIILLFRNKTRISDKYRQLNIKVSNFEYPENIIEPLFLQENIISEIRNDIINGFRHSQRITIVKNWVAQPSLNLDFIFSRAVMEHVSSPSNVYSGITVHLKEGSLMFHDIEFHSHGITTKLDGHYKIPNTLWKIIYGKRGYFLNRWSLSEHLKVIIQQKCIILKVSEHNEKSIDGKDVLIGASVLIEKNG